MRNYNSQVDYKELREEQERKLKKSRYRYDVKLSKSKDDRKAYIDNEEKIKQAKKKAGTKPGYRPSEDKLKKTKEKRALQQAKAKASDLDPRKGDLSWTENPILKQSIYKQALADERYLPEYLAENRRLANKYEKEANKDMGSHEYFTLLNRKEAGGILTNKEERELKKQKDLRYKADKYGRLAVQWDKDPEGYAEFRKERTAKKLKREPKKGIEKKHWWSR